MRSQMNRLAESCSKTPFLAMGPPFNYWMEPSEIMDWRYSIFGGQVCYFWWSGMLFCSSEYGTMVMGRTHCQGDQHQPANQHQPRRGTARRPWRKNVFVFLSTCAPGPCGIERARGTTSKHLGCCPSLTIDAAQRTRRSFRHRWV